MASKKNNALKRQLYGTQFPLPCLQQQQQQHKQQLKQKSHLNSFIDYIAYILWRRSNPDNEINLIHTQFHPQGQCVWVIKEKDMSTLFRQGFFGKGTLSRSEPTWKERSTAGVQAGMSLEEITRKRRAERAQLKLKKAQQQPSDQGQKLVVATPPVTPITTPTLGPSNLEPTPSSTQASPTVPQSTSKSSVIDIEENYEHLQLSLEEAFFLVFAIECISVMEAAADLAKGKQKSSARMSIQTCWLRFAEASVVQEPKLLSLLSTPPSEISASNPFFVRYVVYHHYRSQGWIVKDGLKYGTDFLLYQKGLVFGHSLYAVKVIPFMNGNNVSKESESVSQHCLNFNQTFISPTPGLCSQHQALSWQWLLTLNRVIAQVQKTVILCHVEIPKFATKRQLSHPRTALPLYKVVEIGVKRFIPERNRA